MQKISFNFESDTYHILYDVEKEYSPFHSHIVEGENSGRKIVCKEIPKAHYPETEKGQKLIDALLINTGNLNEKLQGIYEIRQIDGKIFILKEYIAGRSLEYILADKSLKKKVKRKFVISCGLDVAGTLHSIHLKGIVHRNIKPSNIIVRADEAGNIDFENPSFSIVDYEKGQLNGMNILNFNKIPFNLQYSAPEQVLQEQELIDASSDLFSLTTMLYELDTKDKPFHHKRNDMVLNLQLGHHILRNAHMPIELYTFMHKGTQKYKFQLPPHKYEVDERREMLEKGKELRFHSALGYIKALGIVSEKLENSKGEGAKVLGGFKQLKLSYALKKIKPDKK